MTERKSESPNLPYFKPTREQVARGAEYVSLVKAGASARRLMRSAEGDTSRPEHVAGLNLLTIVLARASQIDVIPWVFDRAVEVAERVLQEQTRLANHKLERRSDGN